MLYNKAGHDIRGVTAGCNERLLHADIDVMDQLLIYYQDSHTMRFTA